MVADASIWGRCGSITGSRWKLVEASGRNYRKLEVSVESMEVLTTSMESPTYMLAGHDLSLVSRVCAILLSKLRRESMRLYRNDSNTW